MNESVIHIDDISVHPSPSFPLWYVFSDYQRTCCTSLHPPPSFLTKQPLFVPVLEFVLCNMSTCCRVQTPTLGQTVAALGQIQNQVRQSINEWVSYPYWWHFGASVTIISFVVCLFWLPKNLLHFVASATVISFATCPLWSLWLLWAVKKQAVTAAVSCQGLEWCGLNRCIRHISSLAWNLGCLKEEESRDSSSFNRSWFPGASCAWLKADRKCWHFCMTCQLIRDFCL